MMYKQAIVPLIDYADFLIDSGPTYYVERIKSLHEKAILIIDCNTNKQMSIANLKVLYRLQSPTRRRTEHHASIMY